MSECQMYHLSFWQAWFGQKKMCCSHCKIMTGTESLPKKSFFYGPRLPTIKAFQCCPSFKLYLVTCLHTHTFMHVKLFRNFLHLTCVLSCISLVLLQVFVLQLYACCCGQKYILNMENFPLISMGLFIVQLIEVWHCYKVV